MSTVNRDDFLKQYITSEKIEFEEEIAEDGEDGIVAWVETMPYKKSASLVKDLITRFAGEVPVYLRVDKGNLIMIGKVSPSIEFINRYEKTLKLFKPTMCVKEGNKLKKLNLADFIGSDSFHFTHRDELV